MGHGGFQEIAGALARRNPAGGAVLHERAQDIIVQKIAPGHAFYEHGAGGRFQAHKLTRDKILVFVRVQHAAHGRYIFFQNRGYGFFPFHFAHRIHLASLFALRKMGWRIALSMRKTR